MASSNILGLLFEISADPSKAEGALAKLEQTTGQSFARTAEATEPLNQSLINSHQSVHLLAEEMEVYLPRAVVGAVSEMLPAITAIGPVLLGAFAVKGIYELSRGLKELYNDFDGVTNAEKEMAKFASENEAVLDRLAGASAKVAQSELLHAQMAAAAAASEVNQLQAGKDLLEEYMGPMAAILTWTASRVGFTMKFNDAQKEANRLQELANKLATIWGDDKAKSAEEELEQEKRLLEAHNKTILATLSGVDATREETRQAVQLLKIEEHIAEEKARKTGDDAEVQRVRAYYGALVHERQALGEIEAKKVAIERADKDIGEALARQLETVRDSLTILRALPGEAEVAKINADVHKRLEDAQREIDAAGRLYLQHKITREQMAQDEREYTQVVDALEEERAARLSQEVEKTFSGMLSYRLKIPILPDNIFTPLAQGVRTLTEAEREALPTDRQVAIVHEEIAKILPNLTKEQEREAAVRLASNPEIQKEIQLLSSTTATTKELTKARKDLAASVEESLTGETQYQHMIAETRDALKGMAAATAQSTIATVVHGLAAGESFAKVAKEAIRSIAEQAGVQAIWEAAQGFAMLALSFFIPDPRYVASADAHFTSAAIYGGIAGAAAGISAAIRAPASAAGRTGSSGDVQRSARDPRGDGSGFSTPPQTLAEGSASGRFGSPGSGVVIIRGTQEFENYVAGAVNSAVARGVNVAATTSQRGAFVGH